MTMAADFHAGDLRSLKMVFRVTKHDNYLWLSHRVHCQPAFVFRRAPAFEVPCDTSAALAAVTTSV